jgi:adenylate cyclase
MHLRISLRVTVLTGFLAIYFSAIAGITYYNHLTARDRAERAVVDEIKATAGWIVERQRNFFRPAANWAEVWARRMSALANPAASARENLPSALEMLARNPHIYGVSVGRGAGKFLQISRVLPGGYYGVTAERIPPGAAYSAWMIDQAFPSPERRLFFDEQLRLMAQLELPASGFSAPSRPWFILAQATPGLAVAGPFFFITGQRQGIMFSKRLLGQEAGAIGVSVMLEDFAQFLDKNRVGREGYSVVFNSKGEIIAQSGPEDRPPPGAAGLSAGASLPKLSHSSSAVLRGLAAHRPGAWQSTQVHFTAAGQEYTALMVPLGEPFTGDLHLALIASLDEFLAPVYRDTAVTALISLGLGAAAVPLILWLAFQISRPILRLAGISRRLSRLDLAAPAQTRSVITEIQELFDGFRAMQHGLSAFTKYVPRTVVTDMVRNRIEPVPGGETCTLSILFTDVQDFTRLSEGMPPRDLFRKATTYYGEVGSPILASGGMIGRFMGDGIMAYWNAPLPVPGHPARAAEAVLHARARSEALNRRWESYGWPVMRTRFGLHVGDAIVGNVGLPDRLEYNALGDALNIASRLEGLNKMYGTQILVSEEMVKRLSSAFVLRAVDTVMPKGTTIAFSVCELVGMTGGDEAIAPSGLQLELVERWNARVIPAYRNQDWAGALDALADSLRLAPDDPVARLYLERCRRYTIDPPRRDWDGVARFEEK